MNYSSHITFCELLNDNYNVSLPCGTWSVDSSGFEGPAFMSKSVSCEPSPKNKRETFFFYVETRSCNHNNRTVNSMNKLQGPVPASTPDCS